jgi:hypothetical protein
MKPFEGVAMKKIRIFLLLTLVTAALVACEIPGQTTTTTLTTTNIDQITDWVDVATAAELLAAKKDDHIRLTADINLLAAEWVPFGNQKEPFSGVFDGQGHTISNFRITSSHDDFIGFFGVVTGTILDLNLDDALIDYTTDFLTYAGILAGYISGDVSDTSVSGSVKVVNTASNTYVGILAGLITSKVTSSMTATQFLPSTFERIVVHGELDASSKNFLYAGGLAGKIYNVELNDIAVTAVIQAINTNYRAYVGGLAGHNFSGLLKGFEEILETTDIVHRNLIVHASIVGQTTTGSLVSIGGLYGHSSAAAVENAAVGVTIQYGGFTAAAAGLVGEEWQGSYRNIAVAVQLAKVPGPEFTICCPIRTLGGVFGLTRDPVVSQNIHYALAIDTTATTDFGIDADPDDFLMPNFYLLTLTWPDDDFVDRAIAMFTLILE